MARPRTIPHNTDWLRNNLKRHGIAIPLDQTAEQIADIVASVPTAVWAKVSLAWRQKQHREEWRDMDGMEKVLRDRGQLGELWEEFITRGFVSREDALAIAKGAGQMSFYSSGGARCCIALMFSNAAPRGNAAAKQAGTQAAVRKFAATHGITDERTLMERTGCDMGAAIIALDALRTQ